VLEGQAAEPEEILGRARRGRRRGRSARRAGRDRRPRAQPRADRARSSRTSRSASRRCLHDRLPRRSRRRTDVLLRRLAPAA
jgi:hypothetical protein